MLNVGRLMLAFCSDFGFPTDLVKQHAFFCRGHPKRKLKNVVALDMVPFIFCLSEIKLESPAVGRHTCWPVALQRLQRC
jgi:hypothetical protein